MKHGRGHVIDEAGKVYGAVTVLRRHGNNVHGHVKWLCLCGVCGGTRSILGAQLRRAAPKTCMGRCVVDRRAP
jgi:hypothetical protein